MVSAVSPEPGYCAEAGAVREQVSRICASASFHQSQRRQRFLQFIVEEALAGRGDRLKGYAIAVAVFDKPSTFDPAIDPVVRIEAGRLRDKLREYYDTQGACDPVRIDLPKGSYAPVIDMRCQSPQAPVPAAAPDAKNGGSQATGGRAARQAKPLSPLLGPIVGTPLGQVAVAALLVAFAALAIFGPPGLSPAHHGKPSIAVLPFDNIGRDVRWQRFADGLTEDIITDLAHSRDLVVIARNSTAIYKGRPVDIREVGRNLDVKYVLEGSIQPIGERIRVTAQLIEAGSGSHVWSERYDRPGADLFTVQNDVTQRIASTLISYQGAVAEAERSLVRRKPPSSLTAYETYLLGIEAKHRVTKDSLAEAEALFNRAIELDPQLARAYVGLATVQYYLVDFGLAAPVADAVEKMAGAAAKAVELDPNDGWSHQVLGMAYGYQGKYEQSLAELSKAEALAPSDADLLLVVAWSMPALGQSERAVQLADRALQLNPHYPDWYNQGLSLIYFFGSHYDKSIKYRQLVKQPMALDYAFAALAYANLGRRAEAETASSQLRKLDPAWIAERYLSEAGGYNEREAELFVDSARRAGLPDCAPISLANSSPGFLSVTSCSAERARAAG